MLHLIDDFLNSITMYRLILYYLIGLLVVAMGLGFFHVMPQNPMQILFSTLFLVLFCSSVNYIFSSVFAAPINLESTYITALILALIISPVVSVGDFIFLVWAGVLAVSSKYILAIHNKHVFNPVAIAVVLTALGPGESASWWVGTLPMLPFVLMGGILVVRKIRRESVIMSFLLAGSLTTIYFAHALDKMLLQSPFFFVAFVMLTEPLTTPPTKTLQILYGALVGFLSVPYVHVGSIYSTPELAIVAGNAFSYLVSPKTKLILRLKVKILIAADTWDFLFPLPKKFVFTPGQYMEWTLPHSKIDRRGTRRYFTIASSPTESTLRLGVKFYTQSSSYKKALLGESDTQLIVGSQLSGDFTLPESKNQKLVFIAGGIGITPFRSMLKYCIDRKEVRDIVLFYANRTSNELAYQDILDEAKNTLNTRVICTLTDTERIPEGWLGEVGRVNESMIQKYVPDYPDRLFYISGPRRMVTGFESVLRTLAVRHNHIKTDFFPGFV